MDSKDIDSINKLINFGLNRVADLIQNVDTGIINNIIESSNALSKTHKENTEIIVNVTSSVLQTGTKVAKELIEGTINFNNENLINITQALMKQLLPLNVNIKDSIDKKQIVISQEEINRYIRTKLANRNDINNFELSISDENLIKVKFDISKFYNATISQNIYIQDFVVNPKEAYLNLKINDEMDIRGNDFISKVIIFIIQLLFKKFFRNKLIEQLNKHNIQLNGSVVKIDLKKEVLNNLYLTNLSAIIDKQLDPIIDEFVSSALKVFLKDKKMFDLAQIINIKTEKEKLLIDFKVKLPFIE